MNIKDAIAFLQNLGYRVEQNGSGNYIVTDAKGDVSNLTEAEILTAVADYNTRAQTSTSSDSGTVPSKPYWWPIGVPWPPTKAERDALGQTTHVFDDEKYLQYHKVFGNDPVAIRREMRRLGQIAPMTPDILTQINALGEQLGAQPSQLYTSEQEAAQNAPSGYRPVQLSDGMWGFTAVPQQSLNERIDQLVLSGDPADLDKAWALDNIRDQLNAPRGLTPEQATELVMGLAVSPDEARSWIDMLTADWHAQRGLPPPSYTTPQAPASVSSAQSAADSQALQQQLQMTGNRDSTFNGGQYEPAPVGAMPSPFAPQPDGPAPQGTLDFDIESGNYGNATPVLVDPVTGKPTGAMPPPFAPPVSASSRAQPLPVFGYNPNPFVKYGFLNRADWIAKGMPANVPPWVIYSQDSVSPIPSTSPTTPVATTPFASPQSAPIQVRQPSQAGGPPPALLKSGNVAQFEQQLFGARPLTLQDALQQITYRRFSQQQQRQFQSQRPQRTVFA